MKKYYLGIDLSGPANSGDTAVVAFLPGTNKLELYSSRIGADDQELYDFFKTLDGRIIAGIDAPLSYNPGGGDRPGDRALRKLVTAAGLSPGTVMAPTMTRMVYLTLRGVCLARMLEDFTAAEYIKETHPIAAIALRGGPINDLQLVKKNSNSRGNLIRWLQDQGLQGLQTIKDPSDHLIAACGCALAVWQWRLHKSPWRRPAQGPFHPYDYIC